MRKKRGYDREVPANLVRDYKLFAIACEGGKREPQYFSLFRYLSPRVAVDVIEDVVSDEEMAAQHEFRSAPRWVLDRAMRYIEKEGLSEEDELWFVLDKDRWNDEQLREIKDYCDQKPNWHVAISNPCFEVWLYMHRRPDLANRELRTCRELKHELSNLEEGGYHPLRYIPFLRDAIRNAAAADTDPNHFLPDVKATKLYQLAQSVLQFVGENDFEHFLAVTLPVLVRQEEAKIRAALARQR